MKDKNEMLFQKLFGEAQFLLKKLIEIPSLSREEDKTADLLEQFFESRNIAVNRLKNNIWVYNKNFDAEKPCLLLNSHHDTVKPNAGYTKDPYLPEVVDGKLYGLGSNDAGGCLVALIATFLYYYEYKNLQYNICFLASAEEEISGKNGVDLVYSQLTPCEFAIVGEPTLLNLAVAEKGLMVLDCIVKGEAGHAARDEGINAIYETLSDLNWFQNFEFDRVSTLLGKVKMTVTVFQSGTQHNVIPAIANYVVDVRTNELYSNQEVLKMIKNNVKSEVHARSTRLSPSQIDLTHPIVLSGLALGKKIYGSPTLSDQALLPIPSLKVGPGDSARSHMSDEFIYLDEIYEGIKFYINMLNPLLI